MALRETIRRLREAEPFIIVGIVFLLGIATQDIARTIAFIALMLISGPAAVVWGTYCQKEARRIGNIPSSKIASAAVGPVKVSGTVESHIENVLTPFSQRRYGWYRWVIHEADEKNNDVIWRFLDSKFFRLPFWLKDETGRVLVDPEGEELLDTYAARFEMVDAQSVLLTAQNRSALEPTLEALKIFSTDWSGNLRKLRITQQTISPHCTLYVSGNLAILPEREGKVVRKPVDDPLIISTKSKQETTSTIQRWALYGIWGGSGITAMGVWLAYLGGYPYWLYSAITAGGTAIGFIAVIGIKATSGKLWS